MAYIDKASRGVEHIIFGFRTGYARREKRVVKLDVSLLVKTTAGYWDICLFSSSCNVLGYSDQT